jgi:CRISPR-associated protein Cmr4
MAQPAGSLGDYAFARVHYRCVTPLHVGCGQDVGLVDLPVIRERVTGYPVIPGSGLRGVLRDRTELKNGPDATRLFGAEKAETAGCIVVTEARLLLFPVRSSPGVFRWLTCPHVIERYQRDCAYFVNTPVAVLPSLGSPLPTEGECLATTAGPIFLEEYEFSAKLGTWTFPAIHGVDSSLVLLLTDVDFFHFVTYATVVTQHNRLTSAKTVANGQLFSVEAVPPEAIFYGFLGATRSRVAVAQPPGQPAANVPVSTPATELAYLRTHVTGSATGPETHLIIGGDEGTGLGVTQVLWS